MENATEVTLLFHSGGGASKCTTVHLGVKEYLTTSPDGHIRGDLYGLYIGSLPVIDIGRLNLFICHTMEETNNRLLNVGNCFFGNPGVKSLMGCIGPWNYTKSYGDISDLYKPRSSNDKRYLYKK